MTYYGSKTIVVEINYFQVKNELSGKEVGSLIYQYLYERKAWDRLLNYIQEENIH